MIYSNPF